MNQVMCNLYHILGREAKGKWQNYQELVLKFSAFYNLNSLFLVLL